jgi:hypothetical protein
MKIKSERIKNLCETLCILCGSLCNRKNYTELHGEDTKNHRGLSGLLRYARNDGSGGIMKYLIFAITLIFFVSCTINQKIAKYEPKTPKIYFYNKVILVETDTTSLMKLVRKNYSSALGRAERIKAELDYRINNAQSDSIMMDWLNLNLYLNESRTSYEMAVFNYGEVVQLIKIGQVKIYYKETKQAITKISVKREGSRVKRYIDEVFYDKKTKKELFRNNIYRKSTPLKINQITKST